jgi:enoyl-CoA hydratase
MSDLLGTADHGHVRLITLNRPNARNALSGELIAALYSALIATDADDNVRVLVITGSDPAFCAGIDLKELAEDGGAYLALFDETDCISQVSKVAKPVIGAINGATFTGGLEIALGCDLLIASDRAVFADTHIRVGVLPGGGMTARLSRMIGPSFARRMSMTGEIVGAEQALELGLVSEVVTHDALVSHAIAIAHSIAEVDLDLLLALKRQYVEGGLGTLQSALIREREIADSATIAFDRVEQRRVDVMDRNRRQL